MLANLLALAVGFGSFGLYMAAFFLPEVHRRQDFVWSGVGMFYGLVLWFCAGQITGALLLGQVASVALLGYLGWHMLVLRRSRTPEVLRTPIADEEILPAIGELAGNAVAAVTDLPGLAQMKALGNQGRKLAAEVTKPVPMIPTLKIDRNTPRPTTAKLRFRYQYEYLEDLPNEAVLPAETIEIELEVPIPQPEETEDITPPVNQTKKAVEVADNIVDVAAALQTAETEVVKQSPADIEAIVNHFSESPQHGDTTVTNDASETSNWQEASNWPEDNFEDTSQSTVTQVVIVQPADEAMGSVSVTDPVPPGSTPKPIPPESTTLTPATKAVQRTQPSTPLAPKPSLRPKPSPLQNLVIIKDWVQDWVKSTRKPKPSKPVIKIPPRPPSIPRPGATIPASAETTNQDRIVTAEIIEDDFDEIFGNDEDLS